MKQRRNFVPLICNFYVVWKLLVGIFLQSRNAISEKQTLWIFLSPDGNFPVWIQFSSSDVIDNDVGIMSGVFLGWFLVGISKYNPGYKSHDLLQFECSHWWKVYLKKNPLQDLLSSLNAVISTNQSTQIITGHVIYNPDNTYKFQLKTTLITKGWKCRADAYCGKKTHHKTHSFQNWCYAVDWAKFQMIKMKSNCYHCQA